jgi:DNA-binding transcriptional ArsR family regulator
MPRAPTTSDPFNAIAEPRRREILELLDGHERAVGDIADTLGMAQPSVSKHLAVLLEVGLVDVRREGRLAFYRTNAGQLRAIHEWTKRFERHWLQQILRIKARAERNSAARTTSRQEPGDTPSPRTHGHDP